MKYIVYLVFVLVSYSNSVYCQDVEIIAEEGKYIKDDDLTGVVSIAVVIDGNSYDFITIPSGLATGLGYEVNYLSNNYQLYFSILPLITIYSDFEIVDEPKVLAEITITDITNESAIISYCGIELRGAYAITFPKKMYELELWDDETGDNTNKLTLLNMREDDDWILFGMYGEPLRLRNVNNHALWQEIHTPYYIDQETEATTGIKTKYAEIAINDEYLGVYALGEQVDRKQLKLKKFTTSIRGELYKGIGWGNSTFLEIFAYDNLDRVWGGFEMKYPKEDEITDWKNLYNLVDFVINSTNESFEENISDRFVLNNAIDYFIFINTIRAADNMGRNLYVAKYKEDEPYFYVPWDFDWSFGMWDFEQQNITNDIMSNGLFDRLLNAESSLFREVLVARWLELRTSGALETTSFITSINERYNMLLTNGNYEREILKWGSETIDLDNLTYTTDWIQERFTFLDAYFGNLLNSNAVATTDYFRIFPNPRKKFLTISWFYHECCGSKND